MDAVFYRTLNLRSLRSLIMKFFINHQKEKFSTKHESLVAKIQLVLLNGSIKEFAMIYYSCLDFRYYIATSSSREQTLGQKPSVNSTYSQPGASNCDVKYQVLNCLNSHSSLLFSKLRNFCYSLTR